MVTMGLTGHVTDSHSDHIPRTRSGGVAVALSGLDHRLEDSSEETN